MKRLLGTGIAMMVCAAGLLAHHSYGTFYYTDRHVTLKGTVAKIAFDLDKPHVMLTIQTENSGVWEAEWTSPNTLGIQGVKPDTVKIGDFLQIDGSPSKDPSSRVISALWEIQRPADGWHWVRAGTPVIE